MHNQQKAERQKAEYQKAEHQKNIQFVFHDMGYGMINQYNFLLLFWVMQLGKLGADSLYYLNNIGGSKWQHTEFVASENLWVFWDTAPSLQFIGFSMIACALSHPEMIKAMIRRMPFFMQDISRKMDMQSIIYAVCISLFAMSLSSLFPEIAQIIFEMNNSGVLFG